MDSNENILNSAMNATSVDHEVAQRLEESIVSSLRKLCAGMDAVAIPGFGTFQPVKTDEKISVDENSGKRYLLPPSIVVKWRPSIMIRKMFVS